MDKTVRPDILPHNKTVRPDILFHNKTVSPDILSHNKMHYQNPSHASGNKHTSLAFLNTHMSKIFFKRDVRCDNTNKFYWCNNETCYQVIKWVLIFQKDISWFTRLYYLYVCVYIFNLCNISRIWSLFKRISFYCNLKLS